MRTTSECLKKCWYENYLRIFTKVLLWELPQCGHSSPSPPQPHCQPFLAGHPPRAAWGEPRQGQPPLPLAWPLGQIWPQWRDGKQGTRRCWESPAETLGHGTCQIQPLGKTPENEIIIVWERLGMTKASTLETVCLNLGKELVALKFNGFSAAKKALNHTFILRHRKPEYFRNKFFLPFRDKLCRDQKNVCLLYTCN